MAVCIIANSHFLFYTIFKMYIYYNNNPSGAKIGDCVVRAISAALSQKWQKTYIDLCIEGYIHSDMPNSNTVWSSYLIKHGFKQKFVPDTCPACYTISKFAENHKHGIYIVATGTHAVCVKNGDILDNWNSSNEIVSYYFEKE